MKNNLVKNENVLYALRDMIEPDEIITQITRKTTIKTSVGEHTAWEVYKPNGSKALFTSSKKTNRA